MPLLAATNIRHAFGDAIILDGVSISVEAGERIGIVGRNGTGKTTLLRALTGRLKPDSGEIYLSRGCRVGYLTQDPQLDPAETLREAAEGAFDELHRLHREQHALFDAMAGAQGAELERLLKKQADLERAIDAAGGYAIDHKIDAVLHGLGFTDAQFSIPTGRLSGGQKGRLALAKLLLEEPEILLLDEPTNHLDLDGRLWLEGFLRDEFRGAVVMISHDRYMLDNVVTRIVETEQGRLIDYPGNYAAFLEIRSERRLAQHRAYENQQTKFRKEEAFIRRYKAGQRAKQARGRETRLHRERTESTLERPMELANIALELPKAPRSGDVVAAARGLSLKFTREDGTDKILFSGMDLVVNRGERWGIIGPNGAGKSTLVRCLLGEQKPDAGTARLGSNVIVGYYKQSHEHVDPGLPVYRYLQNVILKECPGQQLSEQQARNLAGAFLFSGDEQGRDMGTLSGGERSRAVLAGLLASAKNLIILDEPTNHLDIPSAERLEEALSPEGGYEGTLILISHDRALIDATCDHLLVLDGQGGAEVFIGDYTEWHQKQEDRRRARAAEEAEAKRRREQAEAAKKAAKPASKQADEQAKPAQSRSANDKPAGGKPSTGKPARSSGPFARLKIEQIESRIEQSQQRLAAIDAELAQPGVWKDSAKAGKLTGERNDLAVELAALEDEWLGRSGG